MAISTAGGMVVAGGTLERAKDAGASTGVAVVVEASITHLEAGHVVLAPVDFVGMNRGSGAAGGQPNPPGRVVDGVGSDIHDGNQAVIWGYG